jgi:hypothetical protein
MRTRKEAAREEILERLARDYADVSFEDETLGAIADRQLFAIRHLAVGKTAPELEGRDMAGAPMKLGDYRGQVVFLQFWGFW